MPRSKKPTIVDDPSLVADDDGLVAVGGTLDPDVLEKAYRMGIFPWSSHPAVTWWCPDPRAIFELDAFRASRSLRKKMRQSGWTLHLDRDFEGTMRRCAEPTASRPSTWISEDFIASYCELHRRGVAHSVEVYERRRSGGRALRRDDGRILSAANPCSRGARMLRRLLLPPGCAPARARIRALLDAQVMNPHLASLGARDISRVNSFVACAKRSR
jgi:leucyl/phenylalanyl-tRNA--protein transferase